jgi:hypothetical protein
MQTVAKKSCSRLGIVLYAESTEKITLFYKRLFHIRNIKHPNGATGFISHNNKVLVISHNCYITVPLYLILKYKCYHVNVNHIHIKLKCGN